MPESYKLCRVKVTNVKIKVFQSLIAVLESRCILGAEPIPLHSLPYPSLVRKGYPFTAGLTDRVFQSSHGEAHPRTHALRRLSAP